MTSTARREGLLSRVQILREAGERAYVVWTTVAQVVTHHESPHLELDHYALVGASGGGVFRQGYHVANNWVHVTITDPVSGTFRRAYSLAALNSENILLSLPKEVQLFTASQ